VDDLSATVQLASGSARLASGRALGTLLDAAAAGKFPPADGSVEILAQPGERDAGVIAFTAFAVVFADTDPGWVAGELPPDDLSAPLRVRFLHALGQRLGRQPGDIDMLACAAPLPGAPPRELRLAEIDPTAQHTRIARALHYRDDVRAWQAAGGVIVLGRGVAGRWETAIEVDPQYRGAGFGSQLASAARQLVPDGSPVWAQIAPGNAASIRTFLRAGFRPMGGESLMSPPRQVPASPDATMRDMSDVAVTDNQGGSQLEIRADEQLAKLVYRTRAGRLILVHTEVPEALGGRGLGGELVRAAIGKAGDEGMTLVPLCPFARSWLERHPDEAATVPIDWEAR
jgi:predicted GNAT family acetyltransferase